MKRNLSLIISIAAVWGCSVKEKPVDFFTRSDFKDSTTLEGETIDFEPTMGAGAYEVVRDSLLFICKLNGDPYYIEVYNLNTRKALTKIAPRGKGPGEFLSCNFVYTSNTNSYFALFDAVAKRAAVYYIDSVLAYGMKYIPKQVQLPAGIQSITPVTSDMFLGYNFYHFNDGGFKNQAEMLLKIPVNDDKAHTQESRATGDFFTGNVSWGVIFPSPMAEQIWVVDYFKDKIEIYNSDLGYVKSLVGPDLIQPQYTIQEPNQVVFNRKQYQSYYGGFSTKSSIYLLYHGLNGVPSNESYRKNVEVFQISWQGELLHRYKLDRYIYSIKVDHDEKYLYGTSDDNPMEVAQLIRYNLK